MKRGEQRGAITGRWRKIVSAFAVLLCSGILIGAGRKEPEEGALTQGGRQWERMPVSGMVSGEWTDRLYFVTADAAYAFGTALVNDEEAALVYGFYDDRTSLLHGFAQEKAALMATDTDGLRWVFLKMRMDEEMHVLDIYRYVQQHMAEDGLTYNAWTMAKGTAFQIAQEWTDILEEESRVCTRQELIFRDGYLYYIGCVNADMGNREQVNEQIAFWDDRLVPGSVGGSGMDEEALYWADHTERVSAFANPDRRFTEIRAVDESWPDQIMANFALMSEAQYQVQIEPDQPKMTVSFRFSEEIPEEGYRTYLWNGWCMDESYQMEVRTEDGRLLQTEEVVLNIDYTDTVTFEDLNGDGCLDMKISYLRYFSGYDERDVDHIGYWLWNPEEKRFERQKNRRRP